MNLLFSPPPQENKCEYFSFMSLLSKNLNKTLKKAALEVKIYNQHGSNYILLFSLSFSYGNIELATMFSTVVNRLILLEILGPERRIVIM